MNPLEISSQQFREISERIVSLATDFLEHIDGQAISPATSGVECEKLFRTRLPEQGLGDKSLEDLSQVIQHSRAQNGRFFGYVLGSGEPVGAAADLLASVINQNVTAWRSGPAAVAIEQTVVGWLAEAIGCGGFHGHLTGGGSSANLMGLAMAREAKAPANESGVGEKPVVYASEEVHMSIPKSVALLGIGRDNLRLVPVDESFRVLPSKLDELIRHDKKSGNLPIAVVASAGTVKTGAIDPLRQIAEIAREHDLWMHVDGAYGALAAIAERAKFDGLELADSISLDPHKWLYQPLDCGCLLYRSQEAAQQAFAHTGDYARSLVNDPVEGFAFFEESIELSRRFRALKLWLSLRYHGLSAFRESIRQDLRHSRQLADMVAKHPDFELVATGDLSAVCFRYAGANKKTEAELNQLNEKVLKRLLQRGRVYLSNADVRGKFCLRACMVNHRTKDSDVEAVISEVTAAAAEIQS
ncbi:MAG TPA: pyridoxal-dependent decarboxylase [Candidatus Sulfotelmatobacter sp.]|nr:pyridoxal-dependent decarboxylase [Candidatus Sulfotelmatobacter sp.]